MQTEKKVHEASGTFEVNAVWLASIILMVGTGGFVWGRTTSPEQDPTVRDEVRNGLRIQLYDVSQENARLVRERAGLVAEIWRRSDECRALAVAGQP